MPYISDKLRVSGTKYDRRVKLTDYQREEIKTLYNSGGFSLNKLAKEYGVSKRLIHFIVCPEKYDTAKNQFRERRKDGRYKPLREDWNNTIREYRKYKYNLHKQGKI